MSAPRGIPSKSQVRKAGDRLRKLHEAGALDLRDRATYEALEVAVEFRALHVDPLSRTAVELRDLVSESEPDGVHFGQRLKRMSRIIEKISLHSTALDRLQDIGGCRVVLQNHEQVRRTADAIERAFNIKSVSNYLDQPRRSGYRAIHLIHQRDGRLIEIQLRSRSQHLWAEQVEKAEEITQFPLKDDAGPDELLEYFRVASEILALEESGIPVDTELLARLQDLRERIRPYYRNTGKLK